MRPLRIEMSGFGAFREPTVIDLADVEFFALVGPTGSGKSTVIDAICFALYGSVPRYDDKRLVGSAMSLGRVEARVALTFAIGEAEFLAVRIVRRAKDGKVSTKEARLARADGTLLAGRASEMDSAVTDLIGLSFEHFTRSVVLPQGEFARFLHDKASDRQDLLVSLLDLDVYERMAAAARHRAEHAEAGREFARRRLDELGDADAHARAAAEARVRALDELAVHLDTAEPVQRALDDAVAGHEERARAARATAVELATLRVPDAVRAHGMDHAEAVARVDQARRRRDETAGRLADAVTARTRAPDRRPLERALETYAEQARVASALAAAAGRAADSEKGRNAAAATRQRAEAAVVAATAAVEAARQASAAHVVAEALMAGAACPVCGQVVHEVPKRTAPPAWQETRQVLDTATAELARATGAERAAADGHARARAELDALVARAAELADTLASAPTMDDARAALEHIEALDGAEAAARQRVVAIDAAIVERSRLEAELAEQSEVATVARELARLLSARGFERWLVADALTMLVAGASLTLRRLSSDQYSLALEDNGEFTVVDHANGDERRGVRTLSGGETFQASLALALALADHLANSSTRGPAKLDAIFLDEGFGTLDADSLETVASTIESLGDGRRTVGIVTHVRELADRVPVRFEVAKGPRSATVERVER